MELATKMVCDDKLKDLFKSHDIAFSNRIDLRFCQNAKDVERYLNGFRAVRQFFDDDKKLVHREIRDWHLIESVDINSPFHLSDEQTHIHLETIFNEEGEAVQTNLCNLEVYELLSDINNSFYIFLKNHINIQSISLHLGFSAEKVKLNENAHKTAVFDFHDVPDSDSLSYNETFARITKTLKVFKDNVRKIGFKGDLRLETLDFNKDDGKSAYLYVTDPDFIDAVISDTGYNLLFDVSHMQISAMNMGYGLGTTYIGECMANFYMPHQLREIHISCPLLHDEKWYDRHQSFAQNKDAIEGKAVAENLKLLLNKKFNARVASPLLLNLETPLYNYLDDLVAVTEIVEDILINK